MPRLPGFKTPADQGRRRVLGKLLVGTALTLATSLTSSLVGSLVGPAFALEPPLPPRKPRPGAPAVIRNGPPVDLLARSDLLTPGLLEGFTKASGVRVRLTPLTHFDEIRSKFEASRGRGFDLVTAEAHRDALWMTDDLLSPLDPDLLPSEAMPARVVTGLGGFLDGGRPRFAPLIQGEEGLVYRQDLWQPKRDEGTGWDALWQPDLAGRLMARPETLLIATALQLDASGELPSNRLLDSFRDEAGFRAVMEPVFTYVRERKAALKQVWRGAGDQANGLLRNGVTMGTGWDGPIRRLAAGGAPVAYLRPKEGSLAWIAGLAIPRGARQVEAAADLIRYLYGPEGQSALTRETGYRSVLDSVEEDAEIPDSRLWHWPSVPDWYDRALRALRDRLIAG